MSKYPFVQGIDYGPRAGTLGLEFHMTEGNGTIADVNYLARRSGESTLAWRTRVHGVSANAVLINDGTVWQMLGWDRTAGNVNPDHRAGEYGYYGHSNLVDVLGIHWTDPNEWSVSMEIAGNRADGPTAAQVKAAIAWGLDMRARFPTLRGAWGHHDQSTKGCPGTSPAMKAIFEGVGGHGLWHPQSSPSIGDEPMIKAPSRLGSGDVVANIPAGTDFLDGPGGARIGECPPTMDYAGLWGSGYRAVIAQTGIPYADKKTRPTVVAIAETKGTVRTKTDAELAAQATVYRPSTTSTHEVTLSVDGIEKAKVTV